MTSITVITPAIRERYERRCHFVREIPLAFSGAHLYKSSAGVKIEELLGFYLWGGLQVSRHGTVPCAIS